MAKGDDVFDVAVCGAGPAGSFAAALLAKQHHRVALIEAKRLPRSSAACVWLGAKLAPLMEEIGVKLKKAGARTFTDVVFHSGDFTKRAIPHFSEPAGYLVNGGELYTTLANAAVKAGAELFEGSPVTKVRLSESRVTLSKADDGTVESKLLLLASGQGTPLVQQCGFREASLGSVLWSARVDAAAGDPKLKPKIGVHVILGLDRRGSFGTICRLADRLSISIHWSGEREQATSAFINLCKLSLEHGLIDVDLTRPAATAPMIGSPAAAALELDSHVGKHSLLIGDAGGFVSAASNEGVYPAMWSAKIATQVVREALESTYSQDVLMSYDSKWRIELADHLRSPNTDTQFLLPLIFSNQAMADRMGTAFFNGANI
ncbi:MAG: NAD(P)/FAD-dependent oxidoreductase [Phycisphaerae bacterium]